MCFGVSLVTTGCSDLLDKEPPSAISDGSFWTGEGVGFDRMLSFPDWLVA